MDEERGAQHVSLHLFMLLSSINIFFFFLPWIFSSWELSSLGLQWAKFFLWPKPWSWEGRVVFSLKVASIFHRLAGLLSPCEGLCWLEFCYSDSAKQIPRNPQLHNVLMNCVWPSFFWAILSYFKFLYMYLKSRVVWLLKLLVSGKALVPWPCRYQPLQIKNHRYNVPYRSFELNMMWLASMVLLG